MNFAITADHTKVSFQLSGQGEKALLFVHGWLGNGEWWDAQRDYFQSKYVVVQMNLPGHGSSEPLSKEYSSSKYAEAIKAVIDQLDVQEVLLIGHSMSGAYALEVPLLTDKVKAIVLVDTLKNLDQHMTLEVAEKVMFDLYRKDFKGAVKNMLPKFLFTENTPIEVKNRLEKEFLRSSPEHAIDVIAPLYKMDVQSIAKKVKVPVRAINSDVPPTNVEVNRKYISDYDLVEIPGTGHYPMLEKPQEFNRILENLLSGLDS